MVRPSQYCAADHGADADAALTGPRPGMPSCRRHADPTGTMVLGTINNCATGATPWGTYLTCEENFNGLFCEPYGWTCKGSPTASGSCASLGGQSRYGITETGFGYRWHEHDERFDAARHPNEPNRFGWVVEIDPFDPRSQPVKHTALGRFKHEGAFVTLVATTGWSSTWGTTSATSTSTSSSARALRRRPTAPRTSGSSSSGTLYAPGSTPTAPGNGWRWSTASTGSTRSSGFASQAEVVVQRPRRGRQSGCHKDGPSGVDRGAPDHQARSIVTLTNNSNRGTDKGPAVDPANPRAEERLSVTSSAGAKQGGDPTATRFQWDVFVLCGDPAMAEADKHGTIKGDIFGSPDGLWFDARGVLWIQTDISTSALNKGDYANMGNNQMLAADPATGEIRRFLTGPNGCEITGVRRRRQTAGACS